MLTDPLVFGVRVGHIEFSSAQAMSETARYEEHVVKTFFNLNSFSQLSSVGRLTVLIPIYMIGILIVLTVFTASEVMDCTVKS